MSAFDISRAWGEQCAFASAAREGVGFSFNFDGAQLGPTFPPEWECADQRDERGQGEIAWTHPSGLKVVQERKLFPHHGAIEYRLRFKNLSATTLPSLSNICALDVAFGEGVLEHNRVVSSGGGTNDSFLPPRNFALHERRFSKVAPYGSVHLRADGGRSSNKDMPFLQIQNDSLNEGIFVAFGWSGQWEMFVGLGFPTPGLLSVWGKIPGIDIELAAGEEIGGPTILIGAYEGDVCDGANRLRRLIRDSYTPKLSGADYLPVAVYDDYWNIGGRVTEQLAFELTDAAADIHQEYYLLDCGWYEGAKWFNSVGNWEKANSERLPHGLGPVVDRVRAKGLKFGLWFDLERVSKNTQLAREHPDWILWDHGLEPLPHLNEGDPIDKMGIMPELSEEGGVVDFGRSDVQEWAFELLDRYIRELNVGYLRFDCNINPLSYWNARDEVGRRGISQIRHIEGVYSVLDRIIARHPDLIMETCASGGRRIDLEMLRRSHTLWVNDHTTDPAVNRYHLMGLNHFLPGNYPMAVHAVPKAGEEGVLSHDLDFQSLFGGAFGFGGFINRWGEEVRQQARLHVETWKKLRRYLVQDYYPLGSQLETLEGWSGWQFHDPDDQSGFIQTFNADDTAASCSFVVRGLDANARYEFTDCYSGEQFLVRGSEALSEGITITQGASSSRVLTYQRD